MTASPEHASCPRVSCGGSARSRFELRESSIVRCARCGLLFRDPMPTSGEIEAMYADEAYHASDYFAAQQTESWANGPEHAIYSGALDRLAAEHGPGARLLDVGCGAGGFLSLALDRGFDVRGIEMADALVSRVRERLGDVVDCAAFEHVEVDGEGYDIVTMWDFIEHVTDPVASLKKAKSLLAPGGTLVVFTINTSSLFNRIGDALYAVTAGRITNPVELLYDKRHNFFFTRETLGAVLGDAGFSVEKTRGYRAYLGRWLASPVPAWTRVGGEIIDAVSGLSGSLYRQLAFARPVD